MMSRHSQLPCFQATHIYPLVAAFTLLLLSACASNAPRPDDEFSSARPVEQASAKDDSKFDQSLLDLQRDPADRSLAEVKELSATMDEYQPELALEILRSLESVPSGQLQALIDRQSTDAEFVEWLELALQIRVLAISANPDPTAASYWANYHYGHVIEQNDFSALLASYRALFPVPSQVAVLLPGEGRLSAAGKAIRDGIMSAYLDQPGDAVIRFYSSGESSESAIAAYRQAVNDGAMQIIGPLHIDSTRAIAALAESDTPVLLLNSKTAAPVVADEAIALDGSTIADSVATGNMANQGMVNSLSLSTTEEATAIATRALAQGQHDAMMIVPDTAWGRRIEAAFATAFVEGDGKITASTRFSTTASDHSAMLTQMLRIDDSKQRKTDLQSWLGINLTFEPSRRSDFDFIFMAANPAEGRELKPLLRFHDAGDVPVYAMGRIYSGRIARTSDQDLNGIVFPGTRWQLQHAQDGNSRQSGAEKPTTIPASVRNGAYGNLYALGQDAWRLLPWLSLLQKDPDLWFPGEVGALKLLADGSLYREPAWAQFSAGNPVAYQWPAHQ